jgi:hypothetical protein
MDKAVDEVNALWTAVLGEPPCVDAPPATILAILFRCAPEVPPYAIGAEEPDPSAGST